ncbi:MAG: hypothetical protein KBD37_05060 [Burkholderiales bacterium]|nr:hypothetical protein [Burkholderiales bacterium]
MKFYRYLVLLLSILCLVNCSSNTDSSSGGSSTSTELGVAVFTPNSLVAESTLWISTQPSLSTWSSYTSGTVNPIIAVGANSTNLLAFDGSNFFMSDSQGGQFIPLAESTGVELSAATIVAGESGFVLYTESSLWFVSNSGHLTADVFPGSADITSIVNLQNKFYAYTAESVAYLSNDGIIWTQDVTAQNIQPFTNVIELNDGLYAAMIAPDYESSSVPNVWLGTSPTSFNAPSDYLENFFGAPAQVNFIATNGNGNLFFNETNPATSMTIRLYYIADAAQASTGSIIQVIAIPQTSDYIKPTNLYATQNNSLFVTTGTTTESNTSIIDPTGPTSLTEVAYVTNPNVTTQLVGSQTRTNGTTYAVSGNYLFTAPKLAGTNDGSLTLITDVTNPLLPGYQILPSGISSTYTKVMGSTTNFMLLLNNGAALLSNGNGFTPTTAINNTSESTGSVAITSILSSGSANGSFLAQARTGSVGNGDLYYSASGQTWTIITQSAITAAHLGTLIESSITINTVNNTYNITTTDPDMTYQTSTPTNLSSWVAAPSPTPLFYIGGNIYTLYPNSNSLGTLNGDEYTITLDALPQYYVSSGNVAYNGTEVALAQAATVVEAADKIAGANYIWTAPDLNQTWTLNTATFSGLDGESFPNEAFNVNPVLLWNGTVWVTQGNGEVLQNTSNLPTNIYTSNNAIAWQAASESSVIITGTPSLFGNY